MSEEDEDSRNESRKSNFLRDWKNEHNLKCYSSTEN